MRRVSLYGIVAALLPMAALAQVIDQGFEPVTGFDFSNGAFGSKKSTAALSLPLTSNGAGFDATGATSNVYWNGSALVDSAGLSWTQNGTVPQVAANALPTLSSPGAAGPFTDANYYSRGAGVDELDSTGQRWGCFAVIGPASWASTPAVVSNGIYGQTGYAASFSGTGQMQAWHTNNPTSSLATTTNLAVSGGLNVGCWWKEADNSTNAMLNLGAVAAGAAGVTETAGTGWPLVIGRYNGAGLAWGERILHVVQGLGACPTPPSPFAASCTGWSTYQQSLYTGLYQGGKALTLARADPLTYSLNNVIWSMPGGLPAFESTGMAVFRGSTNYVLNNRTHPKTAEATASLPANTYVAWHTGTGTMTLAAGTATVTGLSCTAVSPGTLCTFTVTVGGTMAITTSAGTVTAAQIEPQGAGASGLAFPTKEIITGAAAVTRAANVVSVPLGATGNKFCVSVTATPSGSTWNRSFNGMHPIMAGSYGSANTWGIATGWNTSNWSFTIWDGAGVTKTINSNSPPSVATHRFTVCSNGGTLSQYVDGVKIASNVTGTGTGVMSAFPTTLYLGQSSGAQHFFDGYLSNVKVCKGATTWAGCQ